MRGLQEPLSSHPQEFGPWPDWHRKKCTPSLKLSWDFRGSAAQKSPTDFELSCFSAVDGSWDPAETIRQGFNHDSPVGCDTHPPAPGQKLHSGTGRVSLSQWAFHKQLWFELSTPWASFETVCLNPLFLVGQEAICCPTPAELWNFPQSRAVLLDEQAPGTTTEKVQRDSPGFVKQ